MPPRVISGFSRRLSVTAQCEGCDEVFDTRAIVMATTTSGTGQRSRERAKELAERDLQKDIDKINQGNLRALHANQPCPSCGYIQSWMIRENRRQKQQQRRRLFSYLGIGLIVLSLPLGFVIGASISDDMGAMCVAGGIVVVLGIVVFSWPGINARFIYHPNRAWLKERGLKPSEAPATRSPIKVVPAGQ